MRVTFSSVNEQFSLTKASEGRLEPLFCWTLIFSHLAAVLITSIDIVNDCASSRSKISHDDPSDIGNDSWRECLSFTLNWLPQINPQIKFLFKDLIKRFFEREIVHAVCSLIPLVPPDD